MRGQPIDEIDIHHPPARDKPVTGLDRFPPTVVPRQATQDPVVQTLDAHTHPSDLMVLKHPDVVSGQGFGGAFDGMHGTGGRPDARPHLRYEMAQERRGERRRCATADIELDESGPGFDPVQLGLDGLHVGVHLLALCMLTGRVGTEAALVAAERHMYVDLNGTVGRVLAFGSRSGDKHRGRHGIDMRLVVLHPTHWADGLDDGVEIQILEGHNVMKAVRKAIGAGALENQI